MHNWRLGRKRCRRRPVIQYFRPFCGEDMSRRSSQSLVYDVRPKTTSCHPSSVKRQSALPVPLLLVRWFFLNHPVDFCERQLPYRGPSLVWDTVYWADLYVSKFHSTSRGPIITDISIPHVRELLQEGRKFGKMFFVSVCYRNFVSSVDFKTVFVKLLYRLFFHLL